MWRDRCDAIARGTLSSRTRRCQSGSRREPRLVPLRRRSIAKRPRRRAARALPAERRRRAAVSSGFAHHACWTLTEPRLAPLSRGSCGRHADGAEWRGDVTPLRIRSSSTVHSTTSIGRYSRRWSSPSLPAVSRPGAPSRNSIPAPSD